MSRRPATQQHGTTNYDPVELRRYIVSQPDERLVEIVTLERAQYIQAALDLAEAELMMRRVPFAVPPVVQPSGTSTPGRLNKGEDIIAKGCLGVTALVLIFAFTADLSGFARWFWPGLWGWVFVPFILAGMFGAVGWMIRKLRRQP
jgi:hypothetical protein